MPALKLIATPDAELLRIGAELDGAERDWRALHEAEQRRDAAKEAACRAVGLPAIALMDPTNREEMRAWEIYERRRNMVPYEGKDEADADCNERGESIARNGINDRLFKLMDRALALRATTVAGLAVQLRGFDLAVGDTIDEPDVENLLSAAMAFAAVKPARAPHHRPEPPGAT